MKKKYIICVGLIGAIIFTSGIAYATDLREELTSYLKDPSLDFLGHEFEKILFNKIQNGDNNFLEELKFVLEDIRTIPLQAKAMYKIFTQPPNIIAYGSLGSTFGLKTALGTSAFNEASVQIFNMSKNVKFIEVLKSLFKLLKI